MTKFSVPDTSCGHCKSAIERAIAGVDAAATVSIDLDKREVKIETHLDQGSVIAAMKAEGYAAHALP